MQIRAENTRTIQIFVYGVLIRVASEYEKLKAVVVEAEGKDAICAAIDGGGIGEVEGLPGGGVWLSVKAHNSLHIVWRSFKVIIHPTKAVNIPMPHRLKRQ